MDKDFAELRKQADEKAKQSFAEADERDQYFLHLIDNFCYRYLEDDKCAPYSFAIHSPGIYIGKAKTFSMKQVFDLVNEDQASNIKEAVKQAIKNKNRPTIELGLLIDAADLDDEGAGQVTIKAIWNWDFPEHQNNKMQFEKASHYPMEDWGYLRKNLALHLEDVCQEFS